MYRKLIWIALATVFVACGGKQEKKDSSDANNAKTEVSKDQESGNVAIDMDNKGIGPIKELTFDSEINKELAAKGEATFNMICTACHMTDQRMIGPAMKGIYERRSPEWVMNMLLNPGGMLEEDPIAKALLKEYNNMVMTNQNLSEEDAREIAEYLRTL
ncbi:c-type cytochrome [Lentiprolixibacter aurantiacus]|uniref:Cytochrome c n=1 Tax=Lentiprolixibacter aurantiacus TaxID=2993939 RepID=A0AAE3MJG4_9FLAO|nr:cytochrome c [Lentiprolixibacter aurantiacus]MCX2718343.1 cytochrome c [Lentiprolixibacter aurantiacus]